MHFHVYLNRQMKTSVAQIGKKPAIALFTAHVCFLSWGVNEIEQVSLVKYLHLVIDFCNGIFAPARLYHTLPHHSWVLRKKCSNHSQATFHCHIMWLSQTFVWSGNSTPFSSSFPFSSSYIHSCITERVIGWVYWECELMKVLLNI